LHSDTVIGCESREIFQGVVVIEPGSIGEGTDRDMFYAHFIRPETDRRGPESETRTGRADAYGSKTDDFREMLVGTAGFEPAALCSQSRCATRLRHVPTAKTGD
jgi:hypothetical protein